MAFLRGLLFRLGLGALPLLVVILLCCLMMGWPLRNHSLNGPIRPPGLTAQAAVVPPSERVTLPAETNEPPAIAKFQSLHIEHAVVHVPR
jgi:hypothetical protein